MFRILLLALACLPALAEEPIRVQERRQFAPPPPESPATHRLHLSLAWLEDSGWSAERIVAATAQAAAILSQCRIEVQGAELLRIRAPARYRDFLTPLSQELARAVPLQRPAVWFLRGSRQRPAFDAEAIGRGNSRTRPELADTVWVTAATRDLGIALAHELAHVLMDSGEHSDEPDNLMRAETSPEATRLSEAQCERVLQVGTGHGLLQR